jgi:endoglucanase
MIIDALDLAQSWSKKHGYPLHVGEFGAYKAADMNSRASYIRFIRDEMEQRGMGWTYWDFASSFGIFDPKAGVWIDPLRRALLD